MKKVIDDFFGSAKGSGSGMFRGNSRALSFARSLTKMQRKKYQRYGIVPAVFIVCLREMEILRSDVPIPKGGASVRKVNDIIKKHILGDEQHRHIKDYRQRLRIKKLCRPEMKDSHFACRSSFWENMEK